MGAAILEMKNCFTTFDWFILDKPSFKPMELSLTNPSQDTAWQQHLHILHVKMPVRIDPPPPVHGEQPGVATSLLYNGSRFQGHQKSKGNCYDVEVILQVPLSTHLIS